MRTPSIGAVKKGSKNTDVIVKGNLNVEFDFSFDRESNMSKQDYIDFVKDTISYACTKSYQSGQIWPTKFTVKKVSF